MGRHNDEWLEVGIRRDEEEDDEPQLDQETKEDG